jgi:hypothetical protein
MTKMSSFIFWLIWRRSKKNLLTNGALEGGLEGVLELIWSTFFMSKVSHNKSSPINHLTCVIVHKSL